MSHLAALCTAFVSSGACSGTLSLQTESVSNFLLDLSSGHFCHVLGTEILHNFLWSDFQVFHVLFLILRNVDIGDLFGDSVKKSALAEWAGSLPPRPPFVRSCDSAPVLAGCLARLPLFVPVEGQEPRRIVRRCTQESALPARTIVQNAPAVPLCASMC